VYVYMCFGAKEYNLYIVAQVVKCSHSSEDESMVKSLWKLLEFFRCLVDRLLASLSCYFTFQVSLPNSLSVMHLITHTYSYNLVWSLQFLHWITFPEMIEKTKSFHKI